MWDDVRVYLLLFLDGSRVYLQPIYTYGASNAMRHNNSNAHKSFVQYLWGGPSTKDIFALRGIVNRLNQHHVPKQYARASIYYMVYMTARTRCASGIKSFYFEKVLYFCVVCGVCVCEWIMRGAGRDVPRRWEVSPRERENQETYNCTHAHREIASSRCDSRTNENVYARLATYADRTNAIRR